jgi:predicted nucleic acid-binding protein
MAGPYTVDASVFLNAFNPGEVGQADSNRFLSLLQTRAIPTIAPTLLLPEVSAAISRGRHAKRTNLARAFANTLSRLPHLVLVPLDTVLAQQAAEVAAQNRLRGSDAVYAAIALRFGALLVTLDREQHDRVAKVLMTSTPTQALTNLAT